MRSVVAVAILILLNLPCAAQEPEGYLGLEIVGNRVVYTRKYTPAESAGLLPGDQILAIDAKPVEGLSRDEIGQLWRGASGRPVTLSIRRGIKDFAITMITRADFPPNFVPDGLSALEYYKLGVKQRELGYPNEARESLKRAISKDTTGTVSKNAERYLRTQVPIKYVPPAAQALNNQAWNHSRSERDAEAEVLFRECIKMCPDFEWPRNNLAGICRDSKRFAEAEELLKHNFEVHPDYVPSWVELSNIKCAQGNLKEAKKCASHALELDPDSKSAQEACARVEYYESKNAHEPPVKKQK